MDFVRNFLGLSQNLHRTSSELSADFSGLFIDFPMPFSGLSQDFHRAFTVLSQNFIRIFSGLSQDFLRTFSGHSEFGTDCLGLVITL